MQFNSYIFIMLFLPLTLLVYFLANRFNLTAGKLCLILASAVFYLYAGVDVALGLGLSILLNYLFSLYMSGERKGRKAVFILALLLNIAALLYFKYRNFFVEEISRLIPLHLAEKELILPLGISFFTFQQISYLVSVYRDKSRHACPVNYLLYVLYFPKLVMGPITEADELIAQFDDPVRKKPDWENMASGARMFAYGLFKKAFFADTFSAAAVWLFSNLPAANSADIFIGMLSYTFQIYFDFSGYSDMAIGISSMFNIELPMNFDSPYKALSIRDFWKRWHISLTKFLTKYIYIPLGGNRKGLIRGYANIMLVFLVSGIWHGANWTFILWGLLHGALSVGERIFEKSFNRLSEAARWLYTFVCVNLLWLLFASGSIREWVFMIKKMLLVQYGWISPDMIRNFMIPESNMINEFLTDYLYAGMPQELTGIWLLIMMAAALFVCLFPENCYRTRKKFHPAGAVCAAVAFAWGLICLGGESSFVYFGF